MILLESKIRFGRSIILNNLSRLIYKSADIGSTFTDYASFIIYLSPYQNLYSFVY